MIDVIIPAYRGLTETRRCIEGVLAAAVAAPHEVVVIDDASPEPELASWLKAAAATGRFRLITHGRNAGFVASVNEGMGLHPDRDVVLLNSDTEVADGWLDRLAACAAREPRAATVTPFSNSATICSYPRFATPGAMPTGCTTASLDGVFARANAGRAVEIPTAVGFCMFIRRACLDEVGRFDEAAFGRGYGEEVDFCLRASRSGWRHLHAADTFVFHAGEVSFGGGAPDIRRNAQAIIDTRYPEFQPRLAAFLAADPARPLRRAADLERLRLSAPALTLATETPGALEQGTDNRVDRAPTLSLQAVGADCLRLSWPSEGEEFEAHFRFPGDWDALAALLAALRAGRAPPHLESHMLRRPELPAPERMAVRPAHEGEAAAARQALEEALADAVRRLNAIESSTSWRLTAPLRRAVERSRAALQAVLGSPQGPGSRQ